MKTAELVLDYLQALVWPAIFVFAVIYLRQPIKRLAERLTAESGELTADVFGVQFSAKFHEKLEDIVESSETAGAPELRQSVKQVAAELARDEFKALAWNFVAAPIAVRHQAARQMKRVALNLTLEELLEFAASASLGERIGAAIGLSAKMESSPKVCAEAHVRTAIARLLDDSNSRVRYRAAEAIQACPEILEEVESQLRNVADEDPNPEVRARARRTLQILRGP